MSLSIPKRGFVLLDTNVLIDTSKYPDEFAQLYAELQKREISPLMEQTIKLEFFRGLKDLGAAEELLNELCGTDIETLSVSKDIYERALHIARIYQRNDNKQTKIADLLIAAQIAKFARDERRENELILATQNHRDFPPILFERIDDIVITRADGSIHVIGFYCFRKKKFETLSQ